ncbi:MAG: glutathione synthase/RimK-type ligase-like ATP-grasp enzyme [Phycisphaerales bacterium]|jgi:glutathione synthase/RimK-type ligase-like ATP-grasp enzyme
MKVALLNCSPLPEPDPDEAPLLAALKAAGHEAQTVAWNTSEPGELAPFDAVLPRATWDYYHDLELFLEWLRVAATHTTLLNPLAVVRANAYKGYLPDLAARGVATVPTRIVRRGAEGGGGAGASVLSIARERGWSELVIKPTVGAGSFLALRTTAQDPAAQAHLDAILAGRDAMVQPFVRSVATSGERSIVCFAGEPSHAVHKMPRFKGEDELVKAADLTPRLESFSRSVLEAAGVTGLLYARVDCFEAEDGSPMLSELELIEPSLFFGLAPGSAERLVRALESRALESSVDRAAR